MEFDPSDDPFSQVPPVTQPIYESSFGGHELTPEELEDQERLQQRELENKERQKKLLAKDQKEDAQRTAKREEARALLKKWHEDRNKLILRTQEMNMTKEREVLNNKASFNDETSWKKVASMIDFKENGSKDQARMKSVLLAKKHESK